MADKRDRTPQEEEEPERIITVVRSDNGNASKQTINVWKMPTPPGPFHVTERTATITAIIIAIGVLLGIATAAYIGQMIAHGHNPLAWVRPTMDYLAANTALATIIAALFAVLATIGASTITSLSNAALSRRQADREQQTLQANREYERDQRTRENMAAILRAATWSRIDMTKRPGLPEHIRERGLETVTALDTFFAREIADHAEAAIMADSFSKQIRKSLLEERYWMTNALLSTTNIIFSRWTLNRFDDETLFVEVHYLKKNARMDETEPRVREDEYMKEAIKMAQQKGATPTYDWCDVLFDRIYELGRKNHG